MKNFIYTSILAVLATLFGACSMTKGLKEGQLLHDQTNLKFANPDRVSKPGKVEYDLLGIAKPDPATGLTKWQVGWYNSLNKKGKERGLAAWLQRKLGKPPVIYDAALVERSRLVMEKYMQDHGYFGATIGQDTTVRGKKVTVNYTLTSKGRYFIRSVQLPADTARLPTVFEAFQKETLVKTGQPYDLASLAAERGRLAAIAGENGYFEINKDNFSYFVDTTAGEFMADIFFRVTQTGDSNLFKVHYPGDDWVFPDFSLERDSLTSRPDTFRVGHLHIVQQEKILRSSMLARLIWQDEGAVFSRKKESETINRLLNLGIFKFANIRFEKEVRNDTCYLDRSVYLTPGLMHDIGLEFQVNSRSGNFLGTEVSASFANKNLFGGAELLSLSLAAGLETNVGANTGSFVNTFNLNANASLGLPGIYAPFVKRKKIRGGYLPRTSLHIGDDFQQRSGFFTVNSFNLSAGYDWGSARWQHRFNPAFVNFVTVLQTSEKLDQLLLENRRLRSSFENVFVLGLSYKWSYSNQIDHPGSQRFFYSGSIESAGNTLGLATSAIGRQQRPHRVLDVPFSQYLKSDHDFRQYFPLRKGTLVGRFGLGIGYPYGNAEVLPYIKQYFIGGASSVRAFRIRTLGPGGYESKVDDDGSNFVDQTGDMRLELNLEYRFPVVSYLKGAVFADAGNIWLIRGDADESTPEQEGLFRFDRFYREIAVGTGFGFRLDFDVAVIRLDLAFPVRKPSLSQGNRWYFSEYDFLDQSWRRENLVWNIAIGYPF